MKQSFAAIILGGTGQVGGAAVAELLVTSECREAVMVTRKPIAARSRVRNVVLDISAADFAERTAALAREVLSQGPVSALSCVGVGSGSMRWSEEELKRLELGVVGAFARGCHYAGIAQFCLLSAAGCTAHSRFRYARVMGMKEDTVRNIGFTRLAIFRPGIIVGNAHTPAQARNDSYRAFTTTGVSSPGRLKSRTSALKRSFWRLGGNRLVLVSSAMPWRLAQNSSDRTSDFEFCP